MNLEQIDTSTTAGKAEVMRLAAEGRKVAFRGRFSGRENWALAKIQTWDWVLYEWAIVNDVDPGAVK